MRTKQINFELKSISETGQIEGYLNTFDKKDYAGDITRKGAFTNSIKAIKESGRKLPILYQHDTKIPIGVWNELKEDSYGLYGVGQLTMEVQAAKEAYALARDGALTGISIGYGVDDEEYIKGEGNYLNELDLKEASLVTFPCNDTSRVTGVKSFTLENEPTERELEDALKKCGISNGLAKKYVSLFLKAGNENENDIKIESALKEALAVFNKAL